METDFENEADNAERMAKLISSEPRLRDRVYIPKVYRELSSKRVMTAEWIEGVRLWDKDALTRPWRGGWYQGSPGCHGAALKASDGKVPPHRVGGPAIIDKIKPDRDYWKGKNGRGGLGLSLIHI